MLQDTMILAMHAMVGAASAPAHDPPPAWLAPIR
jgi:hypothetical protein